MNRRLGKNSELDSIIQTIESVFSGDTSIFFKDYRRYRYGVLKLNEGKTGLEPISKNYLGPVVNESHPGFIELFRALFKDFLFYFSRTRLERGSEITSTAPIISTVSGYAIRQHPAIWNDTLADMVLLQELIRDFL